jgi:hypothetical protein
MAFPTGWGRKCSITIDKTKVPSDQSDYPIMLGYNLVGTEYNLPDEMINSGDANCALSDGGDIRFSSDEAGTTQLPCEIEVWTQHATQSSRKAKIWVKASVSSSTDTIIWVWYKKAGESQPVVTDTYGRNAVWSEYAEVWHLGEAASPNVSSKKTNNITWNGTGLSQSTTGKIGASLADAGVYGTGTYGALASLTAYSSTQAHSYEVWSKPLVPQYQASWILNNGNAGSGTSIVLQPFDYPTNSPMYIGLYEGGASYLTYGDDNITTNVWQHYAATYDGAYGVGLYLNAHKQVNTQIVAMAPWTASNTSPNIGLWYNLDYFPYKGNLQELRVRASQSTDNWVTTNYNNMNAPSTFVKSVGTPDILDGATYSTPYYLKSRPRSRTDLSGVSVGLPNNTTGTMLANTKRGKLWLRGISQG